jgi:fumarylacetoacetase
LNKFAALPNEIRRHVRATLQNAFSIGQVLPEGSTAHIADVTLHLPVAVREFTDFSASREHCLNAGEVITGKRALPPAFLDFPIAYAGRASSIVVSGTPIERPIGQFLVPGNGVRELVCAPSRQVDFELEVGAIIGKPVNASHRLKAAEADEHIFGLVLLNDWSGMYTAHRSPLNTVTDCDLHSPRYSSLRNDPSWSL